MAVRRSRGKHPLIHGERQLHNTVIGPRLRALSKALARVPNGRVLDREADQGKTWDTHTGLFLRRRDGGQKRRRATMNVQQALAAIEEAV
jgi:hypothetical protein